MTLEIAPADFDGEVARRMLADLDRELDERYPGEGIDPPLYDPADYAPPRGVFLLVREEGVVVACGALKPGPSPRTGEVKRMYVVPAARGRRLAERVLAALVERARALGHERLVLETGVGQPEALRLYERLGWQPVPPYGHYRDSPLSRCYGIELA